jgi:excisionase family DNA binding protein
MTQRRDVMEREIMTVAQVADYLQISKKSVYQLVHEGKLPASKVLNKWRFDKHLVKQWVSKGERTRSAGL